MLLKFTGALDVEKVIYVDSKMIMALEQVGQGTMIFFSETGRQHVQEPPEEVAKMVADAEPPESPGNMEVLEKLLAKVNKYLDEYPRGSVPPADFGAEPPGFSPPPPDREPV